MSAVNMKPTITPKSDQMNADDLISGPKEITVTKVLLTGSADQPVAIHFDGDEGKPYKPCKSMRRLMVKIWGPDGNAYVGRSMTLFRDDGVTFGNAPVGGIRISHMSDIDSPVTIPLTERRAQRKPYTVQPMANAPKMVDASALESDARHAASRGVDALKDYWNGLSKAEKLALQPVWEDIKAQATNDAFPGDLPIEGDQ